MALEQVPLIPRQPVPGHPILGAPFPGKASVWQKIVTELGLRLPAQPPGPAGRGAVCRCGHRHCQGD